MKNIHVYFIQLVYAVNYNKFYHKSLGYLLCRLVKKITIENFNHILQIHIFNYFS